MANGPSEGIFSENMRLQQDLSKGGRPGCRLVCAKQGGRLYPERLSKVHDFKLRDEFLQPNRLRKRQNATNCSLPVAWSKKQGIQLPQVILTFLPD